MFIGGKDMDGEEVTFLNKGRQTGEAHMRNLNSAELSPKRKPRFFIPLGGKEGKSC